MTDNTSESVDPTTNQKARKWYTLNQEGGMVYVGEFENFTDADESLEYSNTRRDGWSMKKQPEHGCRS